MKRASLIAAVLLSSTALFAQARGVPASITSYGPGRGMAPGVPASITSPGPHGFGACTQPGCGNAFFFYPIGSTPSSIAKPVHGGHHPGSGHHGNHGGYGAGGYVYVPYSYPVPVAVEPMEPEQEAAQPEEVEAPAPTVFERRPIVQPAPYAEPVAQPAEQAASSEPEHHNMSPVTEEKIPVVVVYKDGHQLEIQNGNYAIVGDMLYDLSGPIAKKIKLADVNLEQTIEMNEQRGVEFNVPASYKPQA